MIAGVGQGCVFCLPDAGGGVGGVGDRRGFVLVCVLWVLAVLTVIALSYGKGAALDRRAAAVTLDASAMAFAARGAVERGFVELRNRKSLDEYYRMYAAFFLPPNWYFLEKDLTGGDEREMMPEVVKTMSKEDRLSFVLRNEEGLINLNTTSREVLERVPGLSSSVVNRIVMRRGMDEDRAGPQPFATPEEIRYLDGFRDEAWMGAKGKPPMRGLFTVWGDGLINVNGAPVEVLRCLPDMDEEVLGLIVEYRKGEDGKLYTSDDRIFGGTGHMAEALGVSVEKLASVAQYCKFTGQFFRITGFASTRGGKVCASCYAIVEAERSDVTLRDWQEVPFGS